MVKIAILIFCAQALLIQSVFSQCAQQAALLPAVNSYGCGGSNFALGGLSAANTYNNAGLINGVNSGYGAGLINGINNVGLINGGNNAALLNGVNSGFGAGYGGSGQGQLAAEGAFGVGGQTELIGSLPVVGVTQFGATIPAAGLVSIVGSTPGLCGCSNPSPCSSGYLY